MASEPYDRTEYEALGYAVGGPGRVDRAASDSVPRDRNLGEHIFIWIAWAVAAIFWGATMTTFVGILHAVGQPSPGPTGGADAGGIGFLLMDVVGGLVLLGLAMAIASAMVARRNRRLDPLTEAATAELYDSLDRQGGEQLRPLAAGSERRGRDLR
jgi:hypothetical protein